MTASFLVSAVSQNIVVFGLVEEISSSIPAFAKLTKHSFIIFARRFDGTIT